MQEILEFLKEQRTFYLATVENGKPRLRPFAAVAEFEEKLYFVTSREKKVCAQILEKPNVEICACNVKRKWVRITGIAKEDGRLAQRQKMLDENPVLITNQRYTSDEDENMAVFAICCMTAECF